jgi:antitoxin component YwqK of YwqJK toxin-antitoxin module
MRRLLTLAILVVATTTGFARPMRDGANHHLGDDSFVVRFGRTPTPADGEALRMRVHLEYVRDLLAAHPATRPELAARRAEMLGYLTDYIAKGTTPINTYVPYRNPVFIDASGNICAVGYLIERSVGRALPERIAKEHRLDYLEDIAAAMPEVAAWVESSGFTLDELASIQPGYMGPTVQYIEGTVVANQDGNYRNEDETGVVTGKVKRKQMTGKWKRMTRDGTLAGSGTFANGAGTWTSFHDSGRKMAQGSFVRSRAEGEWRVYFPSGRVAAIGEMHKGKRDGRWRFFHDAPGQPLLATGPFVRGEAVGNWKHYDARGNLVATGTGRPWAQLTLDIEPSSDGVRHQIDAGQPASRDRLDLFTKGSENIYVQNWTWIYDQDGNEIENVDGTWQAKSCHWNARRLRAARDGNIVALHRLLRYEEKPTGEKGAGCTGEAKPVAAGRMRRIEAMFASRKKLHAPIPKLAFGDPGDDSRADAMMRPETGDDNNPVQEILASDNADDMATYLSVHMNWYIEYPHVDEAFVAVYHSMPGYKVIDPYEVQASGS